MQVSCSQFCTRWRSPNQKGRNDSAGLHECLVLGMGCRQFGQHWKKKVQVYYAVTVTFVVLIFPGAVKNTWYVWCSPWDIPASCCPRPWCCTASSRTPSPGHRRSWPGCGWEATGAFRRWRWGPFCIWVNWKPRTGIGKDERNISYKLLLWSRFQNHFELQICSYLSHL